jgi:GNAT superfamily N-acetyltransferase
MNIRWLIPSPSRPARRSPRSCCGLAASPSTSNAHELLAAEDGDVSRIAEVIFDLASGELVEDLEETLEVMGDRFLILDCVELAPEWRGFGIGALLTATAIKHAVRRRTGRGLRSRPNRQPARPSGGSGPARPDGRGARQDLFPRRIRTLPRRGVGP